MATRVGSGAFGSNTGTTVAATKSVTSGNFLVAVIHGEVGNTTTVTGVADTATNSWTVTSTLSYNSGEAWLALAYCQNGSTVSNTITATFNQSMNYSCIYVEEFSGLATSDVVFGSPVTNTGTTADYGTSQMTSVPPGVVILGVGDFAYLSSLSGTPGDPDFSVGVTDANQTGGIFYLLNGTNQNVTPGGTASGKSAWGAIALAFKDASSGAPHLYSNHLRHLMGA